MISVSRLVLLPAGEERLLEAERRGEKGFGKSLPLREVSTRDGVRVDTFTLNAGGTLRLSNCTITDNIVGGVRKFNSGTIFTRGDNTITGNETDVTPAMTSFTAQ